MFPWNKKFRSRVKDLDFTWTPFIWSCQNAAEVLIPCYSFPRFFITTAPMDLERIRLHHARRQRASLEGPAGETGKDRGDGWSKQLQGSRKYKGNFLFVGSCCSSCYATCTKAVADKVSLEWRMASDTVPFSLAQGATYSRQAGSYPCEIFSSNFKTEK